MVPIFLPDMEITTGLWIVILVITFTPNLSLMYSVKEVFTPSYITMPDNKNAKIEYSYMP